MFRPYRYVYCTCVLISSPDMSLSYVSLCLLHHILIYRPHIRFRLLEACQVCIFLSCPCYVLHYVLYGVHNSIGAPLLGNMEGPSFLRAFEINRYVNMPCKRVSLSIGTPMGNLEEIRLLGLLERK
jgi:hypothetical protein